MNKIINNQYLFFIKYITINIKNEPTYFNIIYFLLYILLIKTNFLFTLVYNFISYFILI